MKRTRKHLATRRRPKRKSTKTQKRRRGHSKVHRGGRLGQIPAGAIVSVQADAYSPRVLVDDETAEQMFESRDAYLL